MSEAKFVTFGVGAMVEWRNPKTVRNIGLLEDFGPGPFVVFKIKKVSTDCNCNMVGTHHSGCAVYSHHQELGILDMNGKIQFLSGYLFKKPD